MQIPDILLTCPLFAGIDRADLAAVLTCLDARKRTVARGGIILSEGEPAREVGILLAGRAQLFRTDYSGNRSIIASVAAGQLFAEAFACAGAEKLPISVAAEEDCDVLLLDCRRLTASCTKACAFHSRIIHNLLQIMAQKNILLHRRALITAGRTTRDKLLTYLMLQAKEAGRTDFRIPFDRQGLADYLEVDRSGLSAELSKLRREGVLDCRKNAFRLLKLPDQHL